MTLVVRKRFQWTLGQSKKAKSSSRSISRQTTALEASPYFATGELELSKMTENWPLTSEGLHQSYSLSSSPF